jgi:2-keto-3-deoxy-L-rhamnonate aldolase RhmA
MMADPTLIEFAAAMALDWVVIDAEQGAIDAAGLSAAVIAAEAHDLPLVVKFPVEDEMDMVRAVRFGVTGVLLPDIRTVESLQDRLGVLRYPPHGRRGSDTRSRSARYGLGAGQRAKADEALWVGGLIESTEGIEGLPEIMALDVLDGVQIGLGDLALDLGQDSREGRAIDDLVASARRTIDRSRAALIMGADDLRSAEAAVGAGAALVHLRVPEIWAAATADLSATILRAARRTWPDV